MIANNVEYSVAMIAPEKKAALVIGHPGHELRVFHWLEIMRPTVFVITDGSGRSGRSRLPSTAKLLDQVGASQGSFYGRLNDRETYLAILNRNFDIFAGLARELAGFLADEQIDYVAGDALEGYNPTHDVCRLVINAAIAMANRLSDQEVGNFAFPLTGSPEGCPDARADGCISLRLDDEAFARKLAAARSYTELDSEVEAAISQNRIEAFRVECLRTSNSSEINVGRNDKPYYEQHGENQVAAGHYRDVIRYREHFLPLAEALRRQVDQGL